MSTKRSALHLNKQAALEAVAGDGDGGNGAVKADDAAAGRLLQVMKAVEAPEGVKEAAEDEGGPLPDLSPMVKDLLDVSKARVARRLSSSGSSSSTSSSSRRMSVLTASQTAFPEVLRERFRIREVLGSGAYAQVWRVIDRDTDEEWAMKVIFKSRAFSQRRLEQEVEALKRAVHPSIVRLHEITSDDLHLFLRQDL